jgi:hypothetical protein
MREMRRRRTRNRENESFSHLYSKHKPRLLHQIEQQPIATCTHQQDQSKLTGSHRGALFRQIEFTLRRGHLSLKAGLNNSDGEQNKGAVVNTREVQESKRQVTHPMGHLDHPTLLSPAPVPRMLTRQLRFPASCEMVCQTIQRTTARSSAPAG